MSKLISNGQQNRPKEDNQLNLSGIVLEMEVIQYLAWTCDIVESEELLPLLHVGLLAGAMTKERVVLEYPVNK